MQVEGQLNMFDAPPVREVSTKELDEAVKVMADARAEYDSAKAFSNEAHANYQSKLQGVMALLKEAGKTRYDVEGTGKVSVVEKLKVKMPSSPEQKAMFFSWLKTQGDEIANHYLTLNYNSLNSLYNLEFEQSENKAEFSLPGIDSPESTSELRFKKH